GHLRCYRQAQARPQRRPQSQPRRPGQQRGLQVQQQRHCRRVLRADQECDLECRAQPDPLEGFCRRYGTHERRGARRHRLLLIPMPRSMRSTTTEIPMKRLNILRKTSLFVALIMLAGSAAAATDYMPVTSARLSNAANDNGWLMYRRDYASNGYAPFKEINTTNVTNLKQVWDYKTGFDQGHEAPAIVNGDYLYITTPKNELIAFQASTGKQLWKYQQDLSQVGLKTVCCDVVNRGVALYGDNVYMATLDNYVVALN